jgi:hypothetical protein
MIANSQYLMLLDTRDIELGVQTNSGFKHAHVKLLRVKKSEQGKHLCITRGRYSRPASGTG